LQSRKLTIQPDAELLYIAALTVGASMMGMFTGPTLFISLVGLVVAGAALHALTLDDR